MKLSTFDAFKRLRAEGSHELAAEELRALQRTLAGILDDIVAVCAAEGLPYALGGGTALGAIRHGGFIPWDDDLDVNMPRAAWPRFRDAFRARFGDRYVVYEPGAPADYPLAFPRIRLRGTRVVTREDLLCPELDAGAFIDVFILENAYDGAFARRLHGLGSLVLGFLYSCRKQFAERKFLRAWGLNGFAFRVKRAVGFLLAFRPLGAWCRAWDRWNGRCRDEATGWVTFPVGRRHFFGELASRADMAFTREETFEGRRVTCHAALEAYMTRLYGPTYMTPPPEDRRERHVVFEPLKLEAT